MASYCFKDAYVYINNVDLSDHVKSVTLNCTAEDLDDTVMGDSTRQRICGLRDWSVDVSFVQDFAAASVDATIWGVYNGSSPVQIAIRKSKTDSLSATNPSYNGNVLLTDYSPIDGSVGDEAETSVSFVAAGDLSRSTSA
ncbi:MAG TPA: hypothetical protein VMX97_04295 [Hyphomicrobiaceae bacterium]|nr:hypothetical protein [Hyphomicrobiaceae bacterium]